MTVEQSTSQQISLEESTKPESVEESTKPQNVEETTPTHSEEDYSDYDYENKFLLPFPSFPFSGKFNSLIYNNSPMVRA